MEENKQTTDTPMNDERVLVAVFRCGYCGQPCDKNGYPLTLGECKLITDEQLEKAELIQGYCCEEQERDRYITVTRDMAIDAGDLSLEGQKWRW